MRSKKTLIIITILAILIISGVIAYLQFKPHYVTSFEDAGGWVYECSKPIRAEDQGVTYMSGKSSLTPINQSDVSKYCQKIGIE